MSIDKERQKNHVKQFVEFLMDNDYYGEWNVKFESGNIVHMKLVKGLKLESLNPKELYKTFINKKQKLPYTEPGKFSIEKSAEGK